MSVTSGTKRKEGGIAETVRVIIHALIIALIIRTFLFQPFNIPSGSMKATLLVGDYLFVSKYSYGYSSIRCRCRRRCSRAASRASGCHSAVT
jgi:signal peptidase I